MSRDRADLDCRTFIVGLIRIGLSVRSVVSSFASNSDELVRTRVNVPRIFIERMISGMVASVNRESRDLSGSIGSYIERSCDRTVGKSCLAFSRRSSSCVELGVYNCSRRGKAVNPLPTSRSVRLLRA